ncbi:MAG: hypothetical protein Q8Q09_09085 [Deltaproteobacteria bacterium]|nr:hypothetical protein [Deltaproteobacteria bacterium]
MRIPRTTLALSVLLHAGLIVCVRFARPTREWPTLRAAPALVWMRWTPRPLVRRESPPESPPESLVEPRITRTRQTPQNRATSPPSALTHAIPPEPSTLTPVALEEPTHSPPDAPPRVSGMSLLTSMSDDVARIGGHAHVITGTTTQGEEAGPSAQALARNVGQVRDHWRDEGYRHAPPPRPAGSTPYLRQIAAHSGRAWNSARTHTPSLVEDLFRMLTGGTDAYERAQRDTLGVFASDRGARAAQELDAVHPTSPTVRPGVTLGAAGRANAQRIAVEIEVTQGPHGEFVSARVARTSGRRWFDQQALDAARAGVRGAGAREVTNSSNSTAQMGWRARWEFEIRIARNPPFTLNPGAAGEPSVLGNGSMAAGPSINLLSGGVEWGGVDPPRIQLPLMQHSYHRVRLLWVTPVAP